MLENHTVTVFWGSPWYLMNPSDWSENWMGCCPELSKGLRLEAAGVWVPSSRASSDLLLSGETDNFTCSSHLSGMALALGRLALLNRLLRRVEALGGS